MLATYEGAVTKVTARCGLQKSALDCQGKSHDDYTADLSLTAWWAQGRFRAKGRFCESEERSYVYKSLWNAGNKLAAQGRAFEHVPLDSNELDLVYDPEPRLDARGKLNFLERVMGIDKFQELVDDAPAGSRSNRRYLAAIREEARELIRRHEL